MTGQEKFLLILSFILLSFMVARCAGASESIRDYATLNPSDKGSALSLSSANLKATGTSASWATVRATKPKSAGKHYFEFVVNTVNNTSTFIDAGIASAAVGLNASIGTSPTGWAAQSDGALANNNAGMGSGVTWGNGDILGVAVDITSGKVWFSKNNVWVLSGNPAAGTNPAYSFTGGTTIYAAAGTFGNGGALTFAPGPTFSFTPPAGFRPGIFTASCEGDATLSEDELTCEGGEPPEGNGFAIGGMNGFLAGILLCFVGTAFVLLGAASAWAFAEGFSSHI